MSRKVANPDAIRSIREHAGFTAAQFAAEVGVSRQAMAITEAGGGMTPRNLKRAAAVLGVPLTALTQPALSAAEICKALHITREEFSRLVDDGELSTISGCVTETALEEYIARHLPETVNAS